jgi:hypothetical protein
MPTAQQQPTFDAAQAERFAALWAGADTGNANEAEAVGKYRLAWRMAKGKGVRVVDAMELPEIRQALDAQMQPQRQGVSDGAALQAQVEELTGRLALTVPKLREVAEALTVENELTAQLRAQVQAAYQKHGGAACTPAPVDGFGRGFVVVPLIGLALMIASAFNGCRADHAAHVAVPAQSRIVNAVKKTGAAKKQPRRRKKKKDE